MAQVLYTYSRRPPAKPGEIEYLFGFQFVVQENGDRVCDMSEAFIPAMEQAGRVRRLSHYATTPPAADEQQAFVPPVVEIKRELDPSSAAPGLLGERPLEELSVLELREVAKDRRVSIPAGTNKEGIIELLSANA